MSTEKVGRTRVRALGPRQLDEVQLRLPSYRQMLNARLDRLGEFLESSKGATQ